MLSSRRGIRVSFLAYPESSGFLLVHLKQLYSFVVPDVKGKPRLQTRRVPFRTHRAQTATEMRLDARGKLTVMPTTKRVKDRDFSVIARLVVEQAIGEKLDGSPLDDPNAGKDPHAMALGAKGGKARAANLTKRKLKEIGKKGAAARWGKKKAGK